MKELQGDIWKFWEEGFWIVIPTNGFVKKNGNTVMGRGLALQAKKKFSDLSKELGNRLKEYGNVVFTFWKYKIITFPVKHNWWDKEADVVLIEKSARELQELLKYNLSGICTPVFIPRVGCGNGRLDWNDVKVILEKYLNDKRFIVCTQKLKCGQCDFECSDEKEFLAHECCPI